MEGDAGDDLLLHPRIAQQGISIAAVRQVLDGALAKLVPFRAHKVHASMALLDWDHRLPSKALTLRVHLMYDPAAKARFAEALAHRRSEIGDRDRFPEFDVPDFAGLPSDEAYDVELTTELAVEVMRLVSPWRRDVPAEEGGMAVAAVRQSQQFAEARMSSTARAPGLGDLEAVAWTPPCESGLDRWTLDVWWLTSFDGRVGRGWSFLVDVSAGAEVAASREFSIRAG